MKAIGYAAPPRADPGVIGRFLRRAPRPFASIPRHRYHRQRLISDRASATRVAVLDVAPGRTLAAAVRSARMVAQEVFSLDELISVLKSGDARISVVAFESLSLEPQRALRELRDAGRGVPIVCVYSEGSPRLRLGNRLWSAGMFDYFVSFMSPPEELSQVLRQAWADTRIDQALAAGEPLPGPETSSAASIRFLQSVGAAFSNHQRVDSLLRELQRRLPNHVDYHVLSVLVLGKGAPKIFVFQRLPVDHQAIWDLAEQACAAVNPFLENPVQASVLEFFGGAPMLDAAFPEPVHRETSRDRILSLPMMFCGEIVGCIAILPASQDDIRREDLQVLQLVASQLATSLHHAQMLEAAKEASDTDILTGVGNRRYFEEIIEHEWQRVRRYSLQVSMVMLDIDHFKRINDIHGHGIGDGILRNLAIVLRDHMRSTDHLVRYGGDEFLLVLPETGPVGAGTMVERIRVYLKTHTLPALQNTGMPRISISAGIASYPNIPANSLSQLVEIADQALLAAKNGGKDRTCVAGWEGGAPKTDGAPKVQEEDEPGSERRKFPRVRCELPATFVRLPDVEQAKQVQLSSIDISAAGLSVRDAGLNLKRHMHGLVYFDDRQDPLLCRVAWVRASDQGSLAGLQFIKPKDLARFDPGDLHKRRSALVLAENPGTLSVVRRVLRSAHYEMRLLDTTTEDIDPAILEQSFLVIVGESSLRGALGRRLIQARQKAKSSSRLVVINEESDRDRAIELIAAGQVEHLINREMDSEAALFGTLNKLVSDDYFGVRRYLLTGADTKTWMASDASDKARVLAGVRAVAEEVGCHPRIIDLMISAVDEMLINALFRAPEEGQVRQDKPVTIECGSDGRILSVSVVDQHGLLKVEDIYHALGEALGRQERGVPEDAGSATLGFRIMLSTLSQVAINVDPGFRTEIIGIVDLRKTLREYRSSAPGLGVFRR